MKKPWDGWEVSVHVDKHVPPWCSGHVNLAPRDMEDDRSIEFNGKMRKAPRMAKHDINVFLRAMGFEPIRIEKIEVL